MSEHDNTNDPAEPAEASGPEQSIDSPAPDPAPATFDAAPVAEAKPRWRDRVFRMRAVAAVAVAGVILGAVGGSVTTALVNDGHRDHGDRHRIEQRWQPGMPMVPPGGREMFPGMPGGGPQDGELPEVPVPPDTEGGTDDSEETDS